MLSWLQSYRIQFLSHDLFAGLTLAAIAIPEQMATARLGGFAPQIGLFAFLAGSLAFAVFGANRFLSCGADSTITPIFAGSLAMLAASGTPQYQVLAAALALMVGCLLARRRRLPPGLDRGSALDTGDHRLSDRHRRAHPDFPIAGNSRAGRARGPMLHRLAIIAGHLNEDKSVYAGDRLRRSGDHGRLGVDQCAYSRRPDRARAGERGRGGGSDSRAGASACSARSPARRRCRRCGKSPPDHFVGLVSLSLIIAVVVMVQTAATTRSFPSDPNEPPDVDRDFVGVGAGSILAGLIGAFPVNASPPRTAVVSETGGRSQLAGLVAVAIVVALLAFGAALLGRIPNAALARRSAVCRAEDRPCQPDHRDLPAVARRIPADRRDGRGHHRASDRAGCRHRDRILAAARHLEHHARAAAGLRTGAGNLDLVAVEPGHPRRERA